ncbi:unnamed protein product [Caretta caretta]
MHLLWLLFSVFGESSGQIVITQTPASVTVLPGETVTIQCKASSSISNEMDLYQFRSGEVPKLLIYHATNRFTGVPDRFSGRYSGTDFTFTISGVQADDEGSSEQIVMTQSPESLTVTPGDKITINCKASSDPLTYVAWYQQKSGQPPKLLIYAVSTHPSGVPERFSGSRSGNDFILTVNRVDVADIGDYYCEQNSSGQVVLTQSPESLSVLTGETVTIKCQSDTDIDDDLNWYQQKSGAAPKLLIYEVSNRHTGVPVRFSSSGYGTDFTFTISSVENDDAGDYYCQQSDRTPLTVIEDQYKNHSLTHRDVERGVPGPGQKALEACGSWREKLTVGRSDREREAAQEPASPALGLQTGSEAQNLQPGSSSLVPNKTNVSFNLPQFQPVLDPS